jgi:crotonobetainyl-CoA:carnitine CoA-transferase CaiB-like acyl-CoA transferase
MTTAQTTAPGPAGPTDPADRATGLDPSLEAKTLKGVRVVEIADEQAEYCGLLLAGLGAEVIKVEPVGGSTTRSIGPFYEDVVDPERSLYFWHYNRGKRSVRLDLATDEGRERLHALLRESDILLESLPRETLSRLGLAGSVADAGLPHLVHARITPFGDEGPWADYRASDLVHLALGGPVMNCGYDPRPDNTYDLPPMAPQMWHAFHITGEQTAMGILAALIYRRRTGEGQRVDCAVHEAVAKCTEGDWPNWVMRRAPFMRQTCRHAMETVSELPMIGATKDGRWVITRGPVRNEHWNRLVPFMASQGMNVEQAALPEDEAAAQGGRSIPGSRPGPSNSDERAARATELMHRLVRRYTFAEVPWQEAQAQGFLWAPLFRPHENLADPHWQIRGTFAEVFHEDLGRSFTYPVSKWLSTESGWAGGRPAPKLGEADALLDQILAGEPRPRPEVRERAADEDLSTRGKPWALPKVRILDFTWFLASGGATRFLSALGAETIKVEWKGNPDTRFGAMAPVGGRAARDRATAPLPPVMDKDMGGQFNNKHPGKYGISLNVKHPAGLEIAKELARGSDIVAEGFSPGVMDKLGLGYDVLRELRPDVIYAQQSAMGTVGNYKRLRTLGPLAQAFSSLSEMSGLPEPAPPAGWGYSYLDWMGAYSFATAMLGALYYREVTGRGQRIDASQVEIGQFLNGTTLLDWTANGRAWQRYGNRSPYLPAAPHGIFPCSGVDRWIAIACFDDSEWAALTGVLGGDLATRPEFATLAQRLAHQDALEAAVGDLTRTHEAYELMHALQAAGVRAGVCQTAEDRCDHDPQLTSLEWLVELEGTKIGRWPIAEAPVELSESPFYIGGRPNRASPIYGEDNREIYEGMLGMSAAEVDKLEADGVI